MLCLVYLLWAPLGPAAAARFADSHRAHPAGADHELVIALKGLAPGDDGAALLSPFADLEHTVLRVDDELVDLGTYREVLDRVDADRHCFVNTESVVLADGWLGHLERNLLREGVGMVATTGSYESPNTLRPGPLRRLRPGYEPFPNPALRTNGFAVERALALALDWPRVSERLDAVLLECGSASLTRQIRARGMETLVVGRDGAGYPVDRWRESRTFRSGGQANLLLADKRTRHWEQAGPLTRRALSWLAWRGTPGPR